MSESTASPLCEDERLKLAEKLDNELEDFINTREKRPYREGFDPQNWEKEFQEHPAFRTDPITEGDSLPPLVEALQQLKYDPEENTPTELAKNYKDDGNYNFKLKKYRWATDAYTEGIKIGCEDIETNAQLYTNRAAAQYHLGIKCLIFTGNLRSSLGDCEQAVRCKPDHMKAITRAVQCCQNLQRYDDVLSWCDKGLELSPGEKFFLDEKHKAEKQKKFVDRNQRKEVLQTKKSKQKIEELITKIKSKGVRLFGQAGADDLSSLKPYHPGANGATVFIDEQDALVWPVLFVYPEHGQTDFIQNFSENDSFEDQIQQMFNVSDGRPPWDTDAKYDPDKLKIYFEDKKQDVLCEVSPKSTLGLVLKNQRYIVYSGCPSFFITVKESAYDKHFVNKFAKFIQVGGK